MAQVLPSFWQIAARQDWPAMGPFLVLLAWCFRPSLVRRVSGRLNLPNSWPFMNNHVAFDARQGARTSV